MAKREIIKIDEEKCNGCGECVPGCPEGALQIIDGKARLVSDLFCDGLGACIGECPVGAIEIEEREAEPYDEKKTMENIIKKGPNTIKAHLKHMQDHGEDKFLNEALKVLAEKGIDNPLENESASAPCGPSGCPGSRVVDRSGSGKEFSQTGEVASQLRQWPVQLHLVPPSAPYFRGADIVLAADCVAYSAGDFHSKFLKGKALAIACPKLDTAQDIYKDKLRDMIDNAQINTLTVVMMEVPCCGGLLNLAKAAAEEAARKVPIKYVIVGIDGNVKKEEWV
ncbi:MAG: ATP-binding protein [Elusimicrobiota bacterium]